MKPFFFIKEADHERKLEILYQSRGYFSAEQVVKALNLHLNFDLLRTVLLKKERSHPISNFKTKR